MAFVLENCFLNKYLPVWLVQFLKNLVWYITKFQPHKKSPKTEKLKYISIKTEFSNP